MKRIIIDIHNEDRSGFIDIHSDDLYILYGETKTLSGLQCNFDVETKEYLLMNNKLKEIAKLAREIVELNNEISL